METGRTHLLARLHGLKQKAWNNPWKRHKYHTDHYCNDTGMMDQFLNNIFGGLPL